MEPLIPSEYSHSFNEVRVIVLLETKPLSDTYVQMEFTRDQFNEISNCIYSTWERRIENLRNNQIIVSVKEREIPIKIDGIASWYR